MKSLFLAALLAVLVFDRRSLAETLPAGVTVLSNIPYRTGTGLTEYEKERCQLDVYLPAARKGFPTLVWFHGGGLTGGKKDNEETLKIARGLAAAGMALVVPSYRLSPKATFPAYVEDAAAAVAWAKAHIAEYGGDVKRLFVGGHSAGGYLALMLGMDVKHLHKAGVSMADIAGFIPVSGQTMTHYTVRGERGGGKFNITADEAAPVHFARKDAPKFLVIYADRDMPARAEENMYFVALMKGAGHKGTTGLMITGRNHGSVAQKMAEKADPGRAAILKFMGLPAE